MRIHIMVFDNNTVMVYDCFENGETLFDHNPSEVRQWITTQKLVPLRKKDTYVYRTPSFDGRINIKQEFLLTENQSALYLLRFQ